MIDEVIRTTQGSDPRWLVRGKLLGDLDNELLQPQEERGLKSWVDNGSHVIIIITRSILSSMALIIKSQSHYDSEPIGECFRLQIFGRYSIDHREKLLLVRLFGMYE